MPEMELGLDTVSEMVKTSGSGGAEVPGVGFEGGCWEPRGKRM